MSVPNMPETRSDATRRVSQRSMIIAAVIVILLGITFAARLTSTGNAIADGSPGNVLVLALPAFLAGLLSFLSPCCLPILPTYFAFTFGARRERIVRMTFAFFLGLATAMVLLGATASALSQLLFEHLDRMTLIGGIVIVGLGVMSLLGKGFSGIPILDRPTASTAGSYFYGATFALGWTACVGPILGALLTMLATGGATVLQGAALAFIYTLGLGTPLIVSASLFSRLGPQSRLWRLMRGRGFSIDMGRTTLHVHTTSIASGLLLIVVGLLLATGQLAVFSQWAGQTSITGRILDLEEGMRLFLLGQ
jgi:cytochrome c-type biogenesis protein